MSDGVPRLNAPVAIEALPDYWDRERLREGKGPSTCGAELRIALSNAKAARAIRRQVDEVDRAFDDVEELFTMRKRLSELRDSLRHASANCRYLLPDDLLADYADLFEIKP